MTGRAGRAVTGRSAALLSPRRAAVVTGRRACEHTHFSSSAAFFLHWQLIFRSLAIRRYPHRPRNPLYGMQVKRTRWRDAVAAFD